MKFWQTPKFKELEREWYSKLKDSGFEDIEHSVCGEHQPIKSMTAFFGPNTYPEINKRKRDYYLLIQGYFDLEVFNDIADFIIMFRHVEGRFHTEISRELKALNLKCNKHTVGFVVRRYQMRWGIRHYEPHQLSSKRP